MTRHGFASALALLVSLSTLQPVAAQKSSEPATVQDLHKTVNDEFERHNYKRVIELYESYRNENPGQYVPLGVKVLYSQSLASTGRIDEAIEAIKEVLTGISPQFDPMKLQYDLANLLFLQRRYDEAKVIYQKIILQSSRYGDILMKARERIGLMKERDGKRKDFASLQILDIETALESGEVPDGAEAVLRGIVEQNPTPLQLEQVKKLLTRIREVRTEKAKALLDEARRLYDQEKKYAAVKEILGRIVRDYSDVAEMPSVEVLLKEVNRRAPSP